MPVRLDELRQLRRPPARDPANPAPPLPGGVTEIDPSGHTFSPSIRAQQKEVKAKFEEAPELAERAKAEFEARYAEGFDIRAGGDAAGALEHFAAAYVLAREMNYRAGEADALNMTGVCYKQSGELDEDHEEV